jgi:hypothetical protein
MSRFDAKTVLSELGSRYSTLTSYQDEGAVVISPEGKDSRQKVLFETRFLRPSLFRFKFSSPHPYPPLSHIVTTTICGQDSASAFTWSKHHDDTPRVEEPEDLMMAVAGATGISSGSAHTIWQLLFRGASDWLIHFDSLSILGEANVEGVSCTVVQGGMSHADVSMKLFIDPQTMAMRRLVSQFESFSSEETRRNIRFNENIDPATFTRPVGEI